MTSLRHFLTLSDLLAQDIDTVIERAIALKREQHAGTAHLTLPGKVLAMIFEKS